MTKQVLILNMTRIGDLVQTIPLVDRLHQEWPGVAIDLVADRRCMGMAALLPGLRHVYSDELHASLGQGQTVGGARGIQARVDAWVEPFRTVSYDRVINLNFTRRSGLFAAALGVSDTRGVTSTRHGHFVVKNPWFIYFVDLLHYRRFNRFNLVDLYALGGSGSGRPTPIRFSIPSCADEWANMFLVRSGMEHPLVAVQVGASQVVKTWRPEYFGRTMATLSRRMGVTFVLTGTDSEAALAKETLAVYRAEGGKGPICDAIGQTDLAQLAALLARCRLLLTNDTSTMHVAVGVGTPTIDLSLGPFCFWETGPYGPGHWVIQPDLPCAPCSFSQICVHHACKDQIVPKQVAELAAHVLGHGPFPSEWSGVQVYESGIDADGLSTYQCRAGRLDSIAEWYGMFWRRFWYEILAQQCSRVAHRELPPPDFQDQQMRYQQLMPVVNRLVMQADELLHTRYETAGLATEQQPVHPALVKDHERLLALTAASAAFSPLTIALMRELHNGEATTARAMARHQRLAYRAFHARARSVIEQLELRQNHRMSATCRSPLKAKSSRVISPLHF